MDCLMETKGRGYQTRLPVAEVTVDAESQELFPAYFEQHRFGRERKAETRSIVARFGAEYLPFREGIGFGERSCDSFSEQTMVTCLGSLMVREALIQTDFDPIELIENRLD